MNEKTTLLTFKHGVSKGVNTYGYNIITLYANGEKVASTNGGGYDMRGTVLGRYIKDNYLERLKTLKGNTGSLDDGTGFYGLTFYSKDNVNHKSYREGDNVYLDGACGENCMMRIANAIGLELTSIKTGPKDWGYLLTDKQN